MIDVDRAVLDDLVAANHILFRQGVVDAFGHVSVRHPARPDRFLLSRNMAPATVTAEDIIAFDLDGTPVDDSRKVYLERFIHGEILRARPDVMAVVHSHSRSVVPFSVVPSLKFRPICHMCGFMGAGASRFEIRDTSGSATDMLIRNQAQGRALADALGSSNVVLMRGHGSTVVAPNLRVAVYRAVYTEVNAQLLSEALRLGPVEYVTEDEAAAGLKIEAEVDRPWNLWVSEVRAAVSQLRDLSPVGAG